jgi:cytochrome c
MKAVPMLDLRHLAVALAVALGALLVSPEAFASDELARSKNCVACHSAERRMIGPSYAAIAARYANDDSAVRTLSERILAGTGGNWGQMPMPAQSNLSQDEAEALVRWILSYR